MNLLFHGLRVRLLPLLLAAGLAPATAQGPRPVAPNPPLRPGDHIVAVINQELVTAFELDKRLGTIRTDAQAKSQRLPPEAELRKQVLDALIEERAVLSYARDSGAKVDEPELDRAVQSVAAQNQITLAQLRERLTRDGLDMARFRANVRDQLMMERVREREVQARIRVTDGDIDSFLDKQRGAAASEVEYNVAQVLVTVAEGAGDALVAQRRARAEAALARIQGGESFAAVAKDISEDANKERGGEIGLRPADRLPDVFLEVVRPLKSGDVAPTLLRTGAGFHALKLVERRDGTAFRITQTRARHILLRTSPQLTAEAAQARLAGFKRQVEGGSRKFEDLAREHSQDGSAAQGGDLGWTSPGQFVPEFEEAMNRLALQGLSAPVTSRFGVHLIQVVERREVALDTKQLREQARTALREQKFEEAYGEWIRELRGRAYVELREAPQR